MVWLKDGWKMEWVCWRGADYKEGQRWKMSLFECLIHIDCSLSYVDYKEGQTVWFNHTVWLCFLERLSVFNWKFPALTFVILISWLVVSIGREIAIVNQSFLSFALVTWQAIYRKRKSGLGSNNFVLFFLLKARLREEIT